MLTSYGGQPISYDAQGNPTSYLGHTLTWEKGRQLKSFDTNTYTYNANGIRTSKTVSGVKHTYMLDGTKVLKEVWGSNTIVPLYDDEDSVCGIVYNGEPYYFVKNLQGDVIAIVDEDVETVAKYSYDAWGVCTVVSDTSECSIATINPYRYRGYYYDNEIGMYYLQSRYYNPVVGRFINADEVTDEYVSMFKGNIFEYCANAPVGLIDIYGYSPQYISNQGDDYKIDGKKMRNISFGIGNIAQNGCGVIAAYNVLLSKSSRIKFNSVKRDIIRFGGLNAGGLFGVNPWALTNYMRSKFWLVYTANFIPYFWGAKAELSEAVIVLVRWKSWVMHYIAGISTRDGGVGGSFRFYNSGLKNRKKESMDGIRMSIWDFLNYLKSNDATPIYFIGVYGKKGWW